MNQVLEVPTHQKKGGIHKCPSCGAALGAFVSHCESCGHEFMDVDANRSITALAERFDEIERELDAIGLKGKRREQSLLEKKARVIRDFPVPNSRDDLQQLIYYIQPRIVDSVKPDPNVEDWRAKFAEVLNRAKNAYKNDAAALAEFERIEQGLNKSLSESIHIKAKRNPLFFALLGVALVVGLFAFVKTQKQQSELSQCEQSYAQGAAAEKGRLERLDAAIGQDLRAKDFVAAQAKVPQLRWEFDAACKADENAKAKSLWQEKAQQLGALAANGADSDAAQKQADAERAQAATQAAADRESAEKVAEQAKIAELARLQAEKERALAAKAAGETRKAAVDKQW